MQTEIHDNGLLSQAATLAGATVAIVKHSGKSGTHKEFDALLKGLEAAASNYPHNPYIQSFLTPATRQQIAGFSHLYEEVPKQTTVNDFKMVALNRCGQAAEWMTANVPSATAEEVKSSILAICLRVAAESKEGGFFNFSSDNVDPFEESVIDEIARALGAQKTVE
jgi:hypothetical protein